MKRYPVERLRNVAFISHGGAGKTQLAEVILHAAGVTERLGRVDAGTSVLDFDPDEAERRVSIQAALAPIPWQDHKINLIDTPGYFDFVGEVHAALRVAEGCVVVCDAAAGVEVGTELVWRYAAEAGRPRVVFVNKMDREHADFERTVEQLRRAFGSAVTPVQLPIGAEASFRGVVDILAARAYLASGNKIAEAEIPADMADQVEQLRFNLIEDIAGSDDALLERYLEGDTLTETDLAAGLRRAVLAGSVIPVLCGSALAGIGAHRLLDAIVRYLPSPADMPPATGVDPQGDEIVRRPAADEPFSGLVFKTLADPYVGKMTLFKVCSGTVRPDTTVANAGRAQIERLGPLFTLRGKEQQPVTEAVAGDIVGVAKLQHTLTGDTLCDPAHPIVFPAIQFPDPVFTVAVEPRSKADEERISSGLARLAEEDPTFRIERNHETRQTLIYGMGELHLEVLKSRLKRKFNVEVDTAVPRVPYRETIRKTVTAEYKHKKQTGGRGQYGHVFLRIEPLPRGEGFAFGEEIFGGAVPRQYIPAVEKGVREAMAEGVLAGYPVTDVKVVLYDGSFHSVDSSEMAFKIAASQAFKKGFLEAGPILLEPIATAEVFVPEEYMGDIMGDLNKRRGRILGMEQQGAGQAIRAQVPLAEMFDYAIDLRSMTQGRGTFRLSLSHYEEVPEAVARQVIAAAQVSAG
ncbi:MAG TPA: elongation factor G [Bacillota bacterium]